jgi:hypothetical protein
MPAGGEWSVGTEQFDDTTVVVMEIAIEAYPRHCWHPGVSTDAPTRRDT